MNTLKIIEGQENYFNKEFVGVIPDIDPFIIDEATPEKILNWHKQSIRQIIKAEIKRKKLEMTKLSVVFEKYPYDMWNINNGKMPFTLWQGKADDAEMFQLWRTGFNEAGTIIKKALEEDIAHLTVLLDNLK